MSWQMHYFLPKESWIKRKILVLSWVMLVCFNMRWLSKNTSLCSSVTGDLLKSMWNKTGSIWKLDSNAYCGVRRGLTGRNIDAKRMYIRRLNKGSICYIYNDGNDSLDSVMIWIWFYEDHRSVFFLLLFTSFCFYFFFFSYFFCFFFSFSTFSGTISFLHITKYCNS